MLIIMLRRTVPALIAGFLALSALPLLAAAPVLAATEVPLPRIAPEDASTDGVSTAQAAGEALELRPTSDAALDDGPGSGDDIVIDPLANANMAPDVGPPSDIRPGTYTLEARLTPEGSPLDDAVRWRIFGDTPDANGSLPLLGEAEGGLVYIRLDPGSYYVHAAYGRAGATRKIEVREPTGGTVVVLNAGGVRLLAVNGDDMPLNGPDVVFDVYAPDEGGSEERFLLIPGSPPGRIIPLNAGTYHVVNRYGDANAVVRADVKVEPGKLTEATVFQDAARLTLKLVEQHGGEALADTAWAVTTNQGERVLETVGAFPSVVLSEGDYTAIASHSGRQYQTNFTVTAGSNRDVEVLAQ